MSSNNLTKLNTPSTTTRVIKGGSIVLFFTFLAMPIGYLIRITNSKILTLEEFGLFYSVLAIFSILNRINDFGIGYSLTYLIPKFDKRNQKQKIWNLYKYDQLVEIISSILIALLLFFASDFLATNYFKNDFAKILIKIFSITFVGDSFFSALQKLLHGLQKPEYYSSMGAVNQILILIPSVILLKTGAASLINISIIWMTSSFVSILIFNNLFKKNHQDLISHKLKYDKKLIKTMLGYALPTLLVSSIGLISSSLDNILLVWFSGLSVVGIYNVIIPLSTVSSLFLNPLNALFFPLFSDLENEKTKLIRLIETLSRIIPYISFYFGLFVFLYPEAVILAIFGDKWLGQAVLPLKYSSMIYVLAPVSALFGTIANGAGLIKDKFKVSSVSIGIKAIGGTLGIIIFGLQGAIVVNGIIYISDIILFNHFNRKKIQYTLPIKTYGKLIIIGLFLYLAVNLVGYQPEKLIEIILTAIVYTISFVIMSIIFKAIHQDDIQLIIDKTKAFVISRYR